MTPRALPFFVLIVSLAVIGGAFFFQYVVGLVPCELCLKERLPWYGAIVLAVLQIILHPPALRRPMACLFAVLFLASGLFGLYHVGVERHIIAGPTVCTGGSALAGLSLKDATTALFATQPVRCDEVQWSFVGVSLAGWNAFISFILAALAVVAALRPTRSGRLFR
jgi:disulfide bond formation protein DsbB